MSSIPDISELSVGGLLALYANILDELRGRGVIHSTNNPIANYSEYLAAKALSLTSLAESNKGFDAIDQQGRKYEVKGRRPTARNTSRQLSMIRELDKKHFDYLVGILFQESLKVHKACLVPYEIVMEKAVYSAHPNAWIFQLRDDVWNMRGVEDITEAIKSVEREIGL